MTEGGTKSCVHKTVGSAPPRCKRGQHPFGQVNGPRTLWGKLHRDCRRPLLSHFLSIMMLRKDFLLSNVDPMEPMRKGSLSIRTVGPQHNSGTAGAV